MDIRLLLWGSLQCHLLNARDRDDIRCGQLAERHHQLSSLVPEQGWGWSQKQRLFIHVHPVHGGQLRLSSLISTASLLCPRTIRSSHGPPALKLSITCLSSLVIQPCISVLLTIPRTWPLPSCLHTSAIASFSQKLPDHRVLITMLKSRCVYATFSVLLFQMEQIPPSSDLPSNVFIPFLGVTYFNPCFGLPYSGGRLPWVQVQILPLLPICRPVIYSLCV